MHSVAHQGIAHFNSLLAFSKERKSAINLSNLGKFAKFDPRLFIYVRQVGGLQNHLCQAGWRSLKHFKYWGGGGNPNINIFGVTL